MYKRQYQVFEEVRAFGQDCTLIRADLSIPEEAERLYPVSYTHLDVYKRQEGYLYMLPWLLGFLILTAWPMVYSFYLSFTDYSMFTAPEWVGLKNYIKMFTRDRGFSKALFTTFRFVLMAVPLKLVFALFVATRLNKAVRGMNLYRTFIYLPSLLGGSVAVAVLWRNIFGIDGYINTCLLYTSRCV